MVTIATLTTFFGWCTVINVSFLILTTIFVTLLRELVSQIHSKQFGLDQTTLSSAYFRYLGNYKIAILIFNLGPYIALKVMT